MIFRLNFVFFFKFSTKFSIFKTGDDEEMEAEKPAPEAGEKRARDDVEVRKIAKCS